MMAANNEIVVHAKHTGNCMGDMSIEWWQKRCLGASCGKERSYTIEMGINVTTDREI